MRPVVHDYAAHIFLVDLSLLYLLLSRVVSQENQTPFRVKFQREESSYNLLPVPYFIRYREGN
ncbi:mCG147177 [Mus musculus]|nr:mCG147177 [Mus musculus]